METPLWISLIGLVLFTLGLMLETAAKESLEFAIGGALGIMIVMPFILYGLSCLQPGGCTVYAWCLSIIVLIAGILTLLNALLPQIDDSRPPTPSSTQKK